jgi:ribosomal protein L40E
MKMKVCSKCGAEKPATSEFFAKAKECRDGLSGHCKVCARLREKAWKQANNPKALRKKKGEVIVEVKAPKNTYMAALGQVVLHRGKKVLVTEILSQGHKGGRAPDGTSVPPHKAFVCGCLVDPLTNKPLTRSMVPAGTDWQRI